MAYFDSPKNKAIWDKRLSVLRSERAVREANGFRPVERAQQEKKALQAEANPFRKKISMEELEKRVQEAGVRRVRRPVSKARTKTVEKTAEKKGPVLG